MTPKLLQKYTKAYQRRLQDADGLNYTLGRYVAIGINDPKHYPKQPLLSEPEKQKQSIEDFMQTAKQRWGRKE